MDNFDEVFDIIGQIGWYQILWIFCALLALFGEGISLISPVFEESTPEFHCNVSDYSLIPVEVDSCGNEIINSCQEIIGNSTVNCQNGYFYNYTNGKTTTATEFDLVCDREIYNTITGTLWYVGQTIGSISFGLVADNFGRKPAILSGTVGYLIFGTCSAFSPNWWLFAIFKSFSGVFMRWGSLAGIMYASEIVGVKYRAVVQCFWYCSYSALIGSLSIFAYFSKTWQTLQLSLTLSALPALLCLPWFYESPRYLLVSGKHEKAEKCLRKIAKKNKKLKADQPNIISDKLIESVKSDTLNSNNYSMIDIFRNGKDLWQIAVFERVERCCG